MVAVAKRCFFMDWCLRLRETAIEYGFGVHYTKILINPIFCLLKGDYNPTPFAPFGGSGHVGRWPLPWGSCHCPGLG